MDEKLGIKDRIGFRLKRECGLEKNEEIGRKLGIENIDMNKEEVEMGLRKRIGELMLKRVMG